MRRQKSAVRWIFRTSNNTRFIDPQPRIPSFQVCGTKGTKIQIFSWNPRIHWAGFWRSWFIPLVNRTQRCLFSARVFTPPRMQVLIGGWGNDFLIGQSLNPFFFRWFFRAESGISEPRHFSKKTDGQIAFSHSKLRFRFRFFLMSAQGARAAGWCWWLMLLCAASEAKHFCYGMRMNIWLCRTHTQRDPIDGGMTPLSCFFCTRKDLQKPISKNQQLPVHISCCVGSGTMAYHTSFESESGLSHLIHFEEMWWDVNWPFLNGSCWESK